MRARRWRVGAEKEPGNENAGDRDWPPAFVLVKEQVVLLMNQGYGR
jgi:hypothetical protein